MNSPNKKTIDEKQLSLSEWLSLVDDHPDEREYEIIDYRFPTAHHKKEYLQTIHKRTDTDIKKLLRSFLIVGGTLGKDRKLLELWRQNTEMLVKVIEKFEYGKRLLNPDRSTWEGNTWIIDLLPDYPQKAIDAINAYLTAHIQFIPDGRWDGLKDSIAIIRSKYLDFQHPRDILIELRPRDFEYLIASLFSRMKYEVTITKGSRDGGYDILANREESGRAELIAIECKRYESNVGVKEVRALQGVVEFIRATKGILVTTSSFSRPAIQFAEKTGRLDLVDFKSLNKLLNKYLGSKWHTNIDFHVTNMQREKCLHVLDHESSI